MSEEDLLSELKTSGLRTGGRRTPLREFKGVLDGIKTEPNQYQKTDVILWFSELDVIASDEAYPFPITNLNITYNENEKSKWGVFADSTRKFVPENVTNVAALLESLMGKRLHMKYTGGHMMWDRDKGMETARECWELVGAEGGEPMTVATGGASDTAKIALDLMDGKTIQEWNQEVFQNPAVKVDGALIDQIIGNTFFPAMKEQGNVTVDDDGILHVAKEQS